MFHQSPVNILMCVYQLLYRQTNRGIKYEYAIKRNASLSSVLPRLPTGQGLVPAAALQPVHSSRPPPAVLRNTAPGGGQLPNTAPLPRLPAGAG